MLHKIKKLVMPNLQVFRKEKSASIILVKLIIIKSKAILEDCQQRAFL